MRRTIDFSFFLTGLIVFGILVAPAAIAQNAAPVSLKDQLAAQYTLTKTGLNSGELIITQPGTVLVIQQAGMEGAPPGSASVAKATYKDGVLKTTKKAEIAHGLKQGLMHSLVPSRGLPDHRDFAVGEKVYVSKLDVNVKQNSIGFHIIECDSCNGAAQPSSYEAEVTFDFPKGSLANPNVTDIEDTIAKVFAIDNSAPATDAQQAPAQQEQPAAQQQTPAEPPAPAQIHSGQSIDDVVAALGQPEKIVDLGTKKLYVYKDLKITFTNGKVSDVQ